VDNRYSVELASALVIRDLSAKKIELIG